MATITITVPDGTTPRIVDALCFHHDYDRRKKPGETKAQFAERIQLLQWKRLVLAMEAAAAEKVAGDAVRTNPSDPLVAAGE